MGFNVSEDEAWMLQYKAHLVRRINEFLHVPGCGAFELGKTLAGEPLSNGEVYQSRMLITWDDEIRTGFKGTSPKPEDIGFCNATGILNIGSVYRQGSNYRLKVFLKECKSRSET